MVRCYLVGNRVAGFGEQHVNALYPAAPGADPRSALEPGQRLYFPPTRADFQAIREKMENEWLGELCRLVGLDRGQLPVIRSDERQVGKGGVSTLRCRWAPDN